MKVSTFKLPDTFTFDGNTNIITDISATNQCLKVLLNVKLGELVGDSNFGTLIHSSYYKSNTNILCDIIKDNVIEKVSRYDHRISINRINASVKEATMNIEIQYTLLSQTSSIGISILLED